MTVVYILFFVLLAGLFAAAYYDISLTRAGIEKGVAIEGNSWIDFIFGTNKPPALDLWLFEIILTGLLTIPFVFGNEYHNVALIFVTLGAYVARIIQHIKGGKAWAKLLK